MKKSFILGLAFAILWAFSVQAQTSNFPDSCFSEETGIIDHDDFTDLGDDIIVTTQFADDECYSGRKGYHRWCRYIGVGKIFLWHKIWDAD